MITGQITADREAVVELILRGPTGAELAVDAVIDTGYTECLTLPAADIAALGLPYRTTLDMAMAERTCRASLHLAITCSSAWARGRSLAAVIGRLSHDAQDLAPAQTYSVRSPPGMAPRWLIPAMRAQRSLHDAQLFVCRLSRSG
jgi:predicted aspartyl protease